MGDNERNARQPEKADNDDESSEDVLDPSVEDFFRDLLKDGAFSGDDSPSALTVTTVHEIRPRRTPLVVFPVVVVVAILLGAIGGGLWRSRVVSTSLVEIGPPAQEEAEPPSKPRWLLALSPGRVATSAVLGYLSFLVGVPCVPGLGDNALLGVIATLAPLFSHDESSRAAFANATSATT